MNRHITQCFVAGALLCAAGAHAAPSGKEIHAEMVATIGIYDDPELTAYVEGLVREIVAVTDMADERWTFTLLDAPDVNAFATEDNYIYVNRGLLAYVGNEAQLVSVLAHEVAHVTENHVGELQSRSGGAEFLAWLAAFLSGSPEVYEAGMAYANSLVKGHGRENELEADEVGARYMAKLGYDPEQTIEMLSVMKDLEALQKKRAAQMGAAGRTYHGIFSTHPRNDMRLRSVVARAGQVEQGPARDNGEDRLRAVTEGMVWGENFKEKEVPPERWADMDLKVRFDFPEGWSHADGPGQREVSGTPEAGGARLKMKPEPRTPQEPEEYLYNYLDIGQLRDGKPIAPARLKGYTGILPGTGGQPDTRIAVVYYKFNAYVFTGEVDDPATFGEYDEQFLAAIDTFRPISGREIAGRKPRTMHYVQATEATTYAGLAMELNLKDSEVDDLRLINGHYPDGEPSPGQWLKVFRQ